jgi:hypothetical protein
MLRGGSSIVRVGGSGCLRQISRVSWNSWTLAEDPLCSALSHASGLDYSSSAIFAHEFPLRKKDGVLLNV